MIKKFNGSAQAAPGNCNICVENVVQQRKVGEEKEKHLIESQQAMNGACHVGHGNQTCEVINAVCFPTNRPLELQCRCQDGWAASTTISRENGFLSCTRDKTLEQLFLKLCITVSICSFLMRMLLIAIRSRQRDKEQLPFCKILFTELSANLMLCTYVFFAVNDEKELFGEQASVGTILFTMSLAVAQVSYMFMTEKYLRVGLKNMHLANQRFGVENPRINPREFQILAGLVTFAWMICIIILFASWSLFPTWLLVTWLLHEVVVNGMTQVSIFRTVKMYKRVLQLSFKDTSLMRKLQRAKQELSFYGSYRTFTILTIVCLNGPALVNSRAFSLWSGLLWIILHLYHEVVYVYVTIMRLKRSVRQDTRRRQTQKRVSRIAPDVGGSVESESSLRKSSSE